MPDRLFEPNHGFIHPEAAVVLLGSIFRSARLVPTGGEGDDDEKGIGWAGKEGKEGRVVKGINIVGSEGRRETELVGELGHYLGVIF